jgi:hypothetical protein
MGDVHNDNPSEEVNIFDKPGAFYGYPYCWWVSRNFPLRAVVWTWRVSWLTHISCFPRSEYNLKGSRLGSTVRPGHTRGTQWLHPTFLRDPRFRWVPEQRKATALWLLLTIDLYYHTHAFRQ